MAKDDTIEVEGKVLEIIPGGKFKVEQKSMKVETRQYRKQ